VRQWGLWTLSPEFVSPITEQSIWGATEDRQHSRLAVSFLTIMLRQRRLRSLIGKNLRAPSSRGASKRRIGKNARGPARERAAAALSLAQGGPFTSIQLKIAPVKVEGGREASGRRAGNGRLLLNGGFEVLTCMFRGLNRDAARGGRALS
jgi:hypothetical protein